MLFVSSDNQFGFKRGLKFFPCYLYRQICLLSTNIVAFCPDPGVKENDKDCGVCGITTKQQSQRGNHSMERSSHVLIH